MEIGIKLNLKRDSDNSYPRTVEFSSYLADEVVIYLTDPERILVVSADELKKAIGFLTDK